MTRINTLPHTLPGPATTHKKPGGKPAVKPFDSLLDGAGTVDGHHAPKSDASSLKSKPVVLTVPQHSPHIAGSANLITETNARAIRPEVVSRIAGTLVQALLYPEGAIAAEYLSELPAASLSLSATPVVNVAASSPLRNAASMLTDATFFMHEQLDGTRAVDGPGSHAPSSTPQGATREAVTRDNESTAAMPLPEHPRLDRPFPERNFHLTIQDGDYHVWLRDYRLNDNEQHVLIERLLQGLQGSGRAVHRITINGQLAWSARGSL